MKVCVAVSYNKSLYTSQVIFPAGARPSFHSIKRLEVLLLLLSPGLDATRFHQAPLTLCRYPFILLGGERRCESQVFRPRTQHIDPARSRCINPQGDQLQETEFIVVIVIFQILDPESSAIG